MTLKELTRLFPYPGHLQWIGLRPVKKQQLKEVRQVFANKKNGLEGDHYKSRSIKRQVSLIQQEHLLVMSALLKIEITPDLLRRNLLISDINLLALRNQYFKIGDAILLGTGPCHPCSRMEEILGKGGYNSMRGHGGITAQIIKSGQINVGDTVLVIQDYK